MKGWNLGKTKYYWIIRVKITQLATQVMSLVSHQSLAVIIE